MPSREREAVDKGPPLGGVDILLRQRDGGDRLKGRPLLVPFDRRVVDGHGLRVGPHLHRKIEDGGVFREPRVQTRPQKVGVGCRRPAPDGIVRADRVFDRVRAKPVRHLAPVARGEQVVGVPRGGHQPAPLVHVPAKRVHAEEKPEHAPCRALHLRLGELDVVAGRADEKARRAGQHEVVCRRIGRIGHDLLPGHATHLDGTPALIFLGIGLLLGKAVGKTDPRLVDAGPRKEAMLQWDRHVGRHGERGRDQAVSLGMGIPSRHARFAGVGEKSISEQARDGVGLRGEGFRWHQRGRRSTS